MVSPDLQGLFPQRRPGSFCLHNHPKPTSAGSQPETIGYHVDRTGRIIEIDPASEIFARKNGARGLDSQAVLNRTLWESVSGPETASLCRNLAWRVRHSGRRITVPLCYDAPRVRGFMQLEMSPGELGTVQFVSRTIARRGTSGSLPDRCSIAELNRAGHHVRVVQEGQGVTPEVDADGGSRPHH